VIAYSNAGELRPKQKSSIQAAWTGEGMTTVRVQLLAAICMIIAVGGVPLASAQPHIVVDVRSGKVIDREQEFDRWYPASLTKLMTVYVTFREIQAGRISLQSPVKVSQKALAQPPSKMGMPVGTVMTVDTAIKILMVKSANDIAVATAESVAGSESAFVQLMNANALRLGMRDTHFANPHGLHDTSQYTTARDLAVLTLALKSEFPRYQDYFSLPAIRHGKRTMQNHNPLLQRFSGTTGMKTGFVCASGLNIVVSAKRSGRELVAVVLGGPTGQERNVRAARLLTEGFRKNSTFVSEKLDTLKPTGAVKTVPVDMRDIVCSPKPKKKAQKADAGTVFALKKPALDELEKKYLSPVGHNAKVITITMGNATGPDPFGLVSAEPAVNATAFADTEEENREWPFVPGPRKVRVPLPSPRPTN
jgi:D-alanyl-D-alanine carboxypeptidase